jgi:hypothetical protein
MSADPIVFTGLDLALSENYRAHAEKCADTWNVDNLKIEFHTSAKKKTKSELMELSSEGFKKERIRFQRFEIDMLDHDSALVVNVSSLFQKVSLL